MSGAYSRLYGLGQGLIRNKAQRGYVAWLAMAALWLLVVAPSISRALPPAWTGPDLGAWCTGHGLSEQHPSPSSPDAPGPHADPCGYCVLLGHSPLLAAAPVVAPAALAMPPLRPAAVPALHGHALPLLSANPRGPPSIPLG
nr:DUF2946 domain-containing protein [Dyella soli]